MSNIYYCHKGTLFTKKISYFLTKKTACNGVNIFLMKDIIFHFDMVYHHAPVYVITKQDSFLSTW